MKLLVLTISTMLSSTLSYADNVTVYRWVDKNNVVHFSQHQPEHNNYTELSLAAIPKSVSTPKVSDTTVQKPKTKTTSNTKAIENETIDKCTEAKANVHTLQSYDNIQYTDGNGELKVLSATEKSQQLAINEKQVEVYCDIP
ncbi:DUF4124 domain-containing protein [Thalassotalea sp. 1_MG-2023]|uniref:DUF4124 domain-containing protein n=1 Tax=Thalassotalea sp. 1_MG-2023 TaxID=3062680 RepID=UPI0026E36543|nr:DUF4124 domain-containing protein [Thalassotalea sp. 1_MG-2023]MDO6427809.1 DUF4124 domain-containing protein [Thalassotalea sp. 1_MG-2023]